MNGWCRMKKLIKDNIKVFISIIITSILCISGTVYATTKYLASDIIYKDKTVENALDELYEQSGINLIATGELEFLSNLTTTDLNMKLENEKYLSLENNTFTVLQDGVYLISYALGSNEYKYMSQNIRKIYNTIHINVYINDGLIDSIFAHADSFETNYQIKNLNKGDKINVKVQGNGGSFYKRAKLKIYK